MNTTPPGRLVHLDGLRCFAFLAVFVHHALLVPLLWAGVDLFFVLSGFLITSILLSSKERLVGDRRSYFSIFYKRRFLRIFPPYYLFITVAFLLSGPAYLKSFPYFATYLNNFSEAFQWGPTPGGLTPMWSLAIEEQFYLLWPLVVWTLGERGLWRTCLAMLVAAPLLRLGIALTAEAHWPAYYLLPCRMDLLAAGALVALAQRRWSDERFRRFSGLGLGASLASVALFVGLAAAVPAFRTGANSALFNTAGYSLVLVVATGFLAYLVPRGHTWVGRFLSWRPLVYMGTISYALYLVHGFVLARMHAWELGRWETGALAFVVTLAVATVSWYALERPLQEYKSVVAPYPSQRAAMRSRVVA